MPLGGGLVVGAAAANLVKSGFDFFGVNSQKKKDEAELARLTPAFYKIQDEYTQNRNDAAGLAQGGLTQGAKDYYGDQAGRGLGTGVSGILSAGGSPNDIAKLFDNYNTGIKSLGVADSEEKINNIKYFHQVNKDLAGQKTIQWGVNEYQPYQNKLKELTQRIGADKLNKNNALNSAIGSVSAIGTGMTNNSLLKGSKDSLMSSLFGDESGNTTEPFQKLPSQFSTPHPENLYKTSTVPQQQVQELLDGMSEEERNMLLQGYFNK